MLIVALLLPAQMKADDTKIFNSAQNPVQPVRQVNQQPLAGNVAHQLFGPGTKLKAESVPLSVARPAAKTKSLSPAKIGLLGNSEAVMTYKTLTTSGNDGGHAVTLAMSKTSKDSISITNFFEAGIVVKAKYDLTTKTISIPNQVIGTNATYGDFDLAVITKDGKPDRKAKITGKINADGSISIDSWWGVFIVSGENANKFFGAFYNTEIVTANATMSYTVWNSKESKFQTVSFGVYATQPSTNILSVRNFGNYGQTVEIQLQRDHSATIASQIARKDVTNGDWSTYSATFKDDYSGLTAYSAVINCNKSTDKHVVSWGGWTMLCTKYYLGAMKEGKIETNFDITYPELKVTAFEGEGTVANPYKLKTLDDLILLSDKVNGEEPTYGTNTKYARPFLGKVFRMENDIDMTNYRFEPIGADWAHQFAGTFDGNGHTLTGLTVNTGANGYAGLFGKLDTLSVVKNVKFDKAVIQTANYYAGVVAAWTLGDIINCHVTNSTVSNTGQTGAGGISAIANNVKDCSVTTSNITGAFGYAAGVSGQVNGTISNCYAVNVSIKAGGVAATYPSGGVVGSLFKGKAVNCYFSGTLDGRYQSDLSLGGVAGVAYLGEIDKCYATGHIYGYGNKASVGGIVGNLYGTVTNSYSNTEIVSVSSRYVGGMTGYVRNWKDDAGNVCESVIKNCYSAGLVDAETYQYNPEKERRESLGTIMEGANPKVENIYFDKQITNFKSTEYGATTAELTSATGPKGFDASVWTFTAGAYPRLKGMDDTEAAKLSASALVLDAESSLDKVCKDAQFNLLGATTVKYVVKGKLADEGTYSSITGNTLKIKEAFGTDTICFVNPNVGLRMLPIKVSPISYEGEGTEASPYLLKTKEDLITLSRVTTVSQQLFPDTYFKLANDIDLQKDTRFLGICASIITGSSDAHVQFAGHIDGAGHTIHNMVIDGSMTWTTKPTATALGTPTTGSCIAYKGFVGRLAPEGSVKNLNIAADCQLTDFWATSAAVVGYNYGTVENCKNYADVLGYSCWIGGIVGQNLKGAVVRNCYNAGKITTGYMNAGGIAGSNYGVIENCQNTGDITATVLSTFISGSKANKLRSVGGITGGLTGGRVVNCVNSGTISGYGRVGGISGTMAEVTGSTYDYFNEAVNCINYGTVLAVDKIDVGSLGGEAGTKGECKDNYYDGQITVLQANGNATLAGTQAVETSVLTSGKPLANYSTDLWSFEAGKYPSLKLFAEEADVKVARGIIINVAAGETAKSLKSNVGLGNTTDNTWTLKTGTAFKIVGSSLVVPTSVKALVIDTLVVTCKSGMVKPFAVESRPVVPLVGAGTAANPYLIGTADDWNALADYIATCGEPMTGNHVKLTADITFEGKEIKPFSYDGVTAFNGILDGNGKKVTADYAADGDASGMLFKTLASDAYVHDLTVDGSFTTAYSKNGGMVGTLEGRLENATNRATVTGAKKAYLGGLVGIVQKGAKLVNCVNEGTVTSAGTYTAGLVGYSYAGVKYVDCGNKGKVTYTGAGTTSKLTKCYLSGLIGYCYTDSLIRCYNTGEVVAANPTTVCTLSGLIGMATADKDSEPYYIKDCYNTASISSAANNAGLIVDVNSSGNSKFYMEGCYNTGDVSSTATGTVSSTYTAGIATLYTAGSTYRNCWNSGTILSQKPVYVAGLFANNKGTFTETNRVRFIGCYNKGDIIASGNQGGGVIAYAANYSVVDSCYNEGNIEGGFGLGGVVAALTGNNTVMSNCWNKGDITTTSNRAGGVIGYNAYGGTTITNCFNLGNVSTTGTAAKTCYGIGGIAGHGGGHYKNVYSYGTIKGVARVGGLIGYTQVGSLRNGEVIGTRVEDSYFAGKVEAPADTCAMIVGVKMTDNPKSWNSEYNYVKNVYYVSQYTTEGVNDAGTALALADLLKKDMGEGWTSDDDYCFPVLQGFCNNTDAKLAAVAALLDDADLKSGTVTKSFYIGHPDDVTITADNASVTVSGNKVSFTKAFTGTLTLTLAAGEQTRDLTFDCKVDETAVGIDTIDSDEDVVKKEYFTTSGVRVANPKAGDSTVYVVVKTYKDGSRKTAKVVL